MVDFGTAEIELSGGNSEIIKNLQHLYSTRTGERPLDMEFGLDINLIGLPMDVAKSEYALEVIEKTERYEPRVEVEEVTFKQAAEGGVLIPHIKLKKADSEEMEEEDEY